MRILPAIAPLIFLLVGFVSPSFAGGEPNPDSTRYTVQQSQCASSISRLLRQAKDMQAENQDRALQLTDSAIAMAGVCEIDSLKALGQHQQSLLYYYRGELEQCRALLVEVQQYYQKSGNQQRLATIQNNIGVICYDQGELNSALSMFTQSLAIKQQLMDTAAIAMTLNNIGNVYKDLELWEHALDHYQRSIALKEAVRDTHGVAMSLNNMGLIFQEQERFEQALQVNEQSIALKRAINDLHGLAMTMHNQGEARMAMEQYQMAEQHFSEALGIRKKINDRFGEAMTTTSLGMLLHKRGDFAEAEALCNSALEISREVHAKTQERDALQTLAMALKAQNRHVEAMEAYEQFVVLKDSLLNAESFAQLAVKQANLLAAQKQEQLDEAQLKVEMETLRKDNALLLLDSQKRQSWILGLVIAMMLIGSLVVLLIKQYKKKLRMNVQLKRVNNWLELQNEEIASKNVALTDSIHYAKRIQEAVLIPDEYLNAILPEHFVMYTPRDIVSGDFYWAHRTKRGESIVAVADCTGHGVPGAFMSMLGTSLLNEIVIKHGVYEPGKVLDELQQGLSKAMRQSGADKSVRDGMAISLFSISPEQETLRYAGSCNALYVVRGETIVELKGDKQEIGLGNASATPFQTQSLALYQGDTIYACTDGFADQFGGPKGKKLKISGLRDLLISVQQLPLALQHKEVVKAFNAWKGSEEQVDDVCMFAVRI